MIIWCLVGLETVWDVRSNHKVKWVNQKSLNTKIIVTNAYQGV